MRIELKNVVKYYQDRLILKIEELRIYDQEKVGLVGLNGAGKTTLLNLMAGGLQPDQGQVKLYGDYAYITQGEKPGLEQEPIDGALASKFKLPDRCHEGLSGGEKTRLKIAAGLSRGSQILLADEPTANLDLQGIQLLQEALEQFPGTLLIVSHDRELLDKLCTKILELEDGRVKEYSGNYTAYLEQKERERKRQEFEYRQYVQERARLKKVIVELKEKNRSVRKTPKRMGNSEARLHKMGNQKAKANLDRRVKATQARLERLESKEKPKDISRVKLELASEEIHSKVVIEGKDLHKVLGAKTIFSQAHFVIGRGEKTALLGDNGSGKTTLIKMILGREEGIRLSPGLKIGYFSQELDLWDGEKTLLEEARAGSRYDESLVRTILARLLFKGDAVHKKISLLSGGEKVRAALAKIILRDFNMLILDEPTNYLDIYSLEAVEEVLADYQGNLLFVSHDRRFVNKIATHLLIIQNRKLISFKGNCAQYLERMERPQGESKEERRMVLENRLAEVLGRLASPAKGDDPEFLDQEYKRILAQLRELK